MDTLSNSQIDSGVLLWVKKSSRLDSFVERGRKVTLAVFSYLVPSISRCKLYKTCFLGRADWSVPQIWPPLTIRFNDIRATHRRFPSKKSFGFSPAMGEKWEADLAKLASRAVQGYNGCLSHNRVIRVCDI